MGGLVVSTLFSDGFFLHEKENKKNSVFLVDLEGAGSSRSKLFSPS